ncbi:MAG: carbohydrate ABC transporter permease [Epsilonproteobacteria bacterium]|nr:carbohydrate ABC transporter permease [Campylobacterota bacterium]
MDVIIKEKNSNKISRILIYLVLSIFAIYFLLPVFVMIITSLKDINEIKNGNILSMPQHFTIQPWIDAWQNARIGASAHGIKPYFINSIMITVPAVLISSIIGSFNGYVFAKWKFKGSDLFFAFLLFGCFIPFQVILLPMSQTLGKLGLSQSVFGLIFVHIVYGISFTSLFFRNFYVSIPTELINAAKIDGAGFFRIFFKILLPVSLPIFMVCIIWQMTQIWNDFLFGVTFSDVSTQPVTVALNNLVNSTSSVKRYNIDMAAALIAVAPTLIAYIVSGKYFVKGLMAGAVK